MHVIIAINLFQQIIEMIVRSTLYYLMMESLHFLQKLTLKEIIYNHKEGVGKSNNK